MQERLSRETTDEVVALRELVLRLQAEVKLLKEQLRIRDRDPYLAEHVQMFNAVLHKD